LYYNTAKKTCQELLQSFIGKLLCPILTAAEGFVTGMAAKMFTVAGPVIVFGTLASVIYGLIYWIIGLL